MTLYLDTSSLVKLYVAEPGSDAVRKLVDDATVVATSSIAYTETRAALARRRRERGLGPAAFASAKKTFENSDGRNAWRGPSCGHASSTGSHRPRRRREIRP